MMTSDNAQSILDRVEEYCKGIIALKGRPSDDNIETAQKVLDIINQVLKK
jgi:hypothetical protein